MPLIEAITCDVCSLDISDAALKADPTLRRFSAIANAQTCPDGINVLTRQNVSWHYFCTITHMGMFAAAYADPFASQE